MCVTIALITIKTRSIIIGIGGALSIAGAAIFTHATYFCIYGRRWFGTLHLAGLFLSIGIGADDVFVIHDHWTHSEKEVPSRERLSDTLEDRLRWTLSRSGFTMGITSATAAGVREQHSQRHPSDSVVWDVHDVAHSLPSRRQRRRHERMHHFERKVEARSGLSQSCRSFS